MFEKEAEEYKDTYFGFADERISEVQDFEGNYIDISERIMKTFIDGAEFGYNKANEWHYVKDGNPKNENDILCRISKDEVVVGYYHAAKKRYITIDGQDIYNIIAWKEIVLPELTKEA